MYLAKYLMCCSDYITVGVRLICFKLSSAMITLTHEYRRVPLTSHIKDWLIVKLTPHLAAPIPSLSLRTSIAASMTS